MKHDEILLITQEECAEVVQAISKVFRFGLNRSKPGVEKTNQDHLEEECGDLLCMIDLLIERGLINYEKVETAKRNKLEKLKTWSNLFVETA